MQNWGAPHPSSTTPPSPKGKAYHTPTSYLFLLPSSLCSRRVLPPALDGFHHRVISSTYVDFTRRKTDFIFCRGSKQNSPANCFAPATSWKTLHDAVKPAKAPSCLVACEERACSRRVLPPALGGFHHRVISSTYVDFTRRKTDFIFCSNDHCSSAFA